MGYRRLALGGAVVALFIAGQNLFGRALNSFFLAFPGSDKVLHCLEFFAVVVVFYKLMDRAGASREDRAFLAATVAVLLAILDESAQRLAPARNVELYDFVANLAGIALGWLSVRRPRRMVAVSLAAAALGATSYVTWTTRVTLMDYTVALQYERQQDFVRARQHYRKALDAGMRTPALFNELGWVEIESGVGDPMQAVDYSKAAVDMQPTNPDFLDTYGWALHHAGRHNDALDALQRAYATKPDMYCIHYHLGAVYLALSQRDLAEHHFRQQLALPKTREAAMAARRLAALAGSSAMPATRSSTSRGGPTP